MITKHEAINPLDPQLWKVLADMATAAADHIKDMPMEDLTNTTPEAVVINRCHVAIISMMMLIANEKDPLTRSLLVYQTDSTIEQLTHLLVALGRGLLPLDEFDNVPEWVAED